MNLFKRWQYPKASIGELVLDRRRIYILPTQSGIAFGLILFSIFITSINYGINLGYALVFILISYGWLAIIFTYKNLAGLGLEALASPAVFAGELAHFAIHINNHSKYARYAVALGFNKTTMQLFDVIEHSSHNLSLATETPRRGWMPAPRVQIQTTFPFGLLTAWSYWKTAQQVLVYPKPEKNPPPLPYVEEGDRGANVKAGNDEFSGVRNYQMGDSLKLLAWRQIARQSGGDHEQLISKHFEGGQQQICVLDFASLPPQFDVEQKLSRLCAWLLMAEQENVRYVFKLGTLHFPQNSGEDHQRACLTALALFK